jgi:3-oxoacid CoA-transferase subunit A
MTYLTGDTHRDFRRVEQFCKRMETSKDDVLVILGDAGINYYGPEKDYPLKYELDALPITLFFVHGNHEMRPESLGTYELKQWRGGGVYVEPEYPSLIFAKDGELYNFDGKRCVAIGGAYSVDKHIRLARGWGWWPDEQPDEKRKLHIEDQLNRVCGWVADAIFAHTCPKKYIPKEMFLPGIDQSTVDSSTEQWLENLTTRLYYDRWFCGHWHTDKDTEKVRFLFNDFIELKLEGKSYV